MVSNWFLIPWCHSFMVPDCIVTSWFPYLRGVAPGSRLGARPLGGGSGPRHAALRRANRRATV